jgi:hypothetical protein
VTQALLPHPATALPPECSLHASARWLGAACLALRYELVGALQTLRLPTPVTRPARREGLWQNSCFELFMRAPGQHAYLEANFSPSGHWAAWVFRDYRSDPIAIDIAPPRIAVPRRDDAALVLEAQLDFGAPLLERLAPGARDAGQLAWQLGLAAVLESQQGALSYWALAHPRERPDFHDAGGHVHALPTRHDDSRRPT